MMFFGYKLVITELWNFDFILKKKKKKFIKNILPGIATLELYISEIVCLSNTTRFVKVWWGYRKSWIELLLEHL